MYTHDSSLNVCLMFLVKVKVTCDDFARKSIDCVNTNSQLKQCDGYTEHTLFLEDDLDIWPISVYQSLTSFHRQRNG